MTGSCPSRVAEFGVHVISPASLGPRPSILTRLVGALGAVALKILAAEARGRTSLRTTDLLCMDWYMETGVDWVPFYGKDEGPVFYSFALCSDQVLSPLLTMSHRMLEHRFNRSQSKSYAKAALFLFADVCAHQRDLAD